ncbi:uncharacterized protein LOC142221622 isoform X2 [Haematobia irritans]|uniref:uncharacterized protein LOC142221622 isoform X2 n=1 Tax=Haematobia irritans TaxID=7368 RepID=UPI003F4F9046
MSIPSNNDGNSVGDDFYRGGINPNTPPQPIQQYISSGVQTQSGHSIGQPPPQFVHWTNPLIGGSPFLQQHHPPQQIFNDVLFNIQAQAAYAPVSSTTQQETYSVLRVGNGNFLKIYHCPDNAMGPMPGETSFTPLHPYNQQPTPQQQTAFHHIQQQAPTTLQPTPQTTSHLPPNSNTNGVPQVFNSYELFSSNTFTQLPTAEMPPILLLGTTTNNVEAEQISISEEFNEEHIETQQPVANVTPITNNNWLGVNPPTVLCEQLGNCQPIHTEDEYLAKTKLDSPNEESVVKNETPDVISEAPLIAKRELCQKNSLKIQPKENTVVIKSSVLNHKSEIPRQDAPKKRIVAEVKPMRMTYSDVLSKVNNQTQKNKSAYSVNGQQITHNLANNRNQQKTATKASSSPALDNNATNFLNPRRNLEDFSSSRMSTKKSPTHDNKENSNQTQVLNSKMSKRSAGAGAIQINGNNSSNVNTCNNSMVNKNSTTSAQKIIMNNKTNDLQQQQQKKRVTKNIDNQAKNSGENRAVSAKNVGSPSTNSTATSNMFTSSSSTYSRKTAKSNNSSLPYSQSGTGQQRLRYQNNSNASYSYSSTKRNRNSSSYGASSALNNSTYSHGSYKNRNYELAKRFLQAWYSYTLKILAWLFNLVYDIVVVGCSILYDRLTSAYEFCGIYAKHMYKDLKQNSNKPGIWFKNACRRFDAKFSKTSKWAFWRKFFKKRPPEAANETVKTGRLPQTGEEAMYQLLNCKGKDAYSILGVPPNSSQEQIRKHYKKIAVLVHPDKNKQPGSEEAFKVLQRAFELIGEPENRVSYDQSLAEALHAEKAWTELHDLLSQLQTKITEAANTIRVIYGLKLECLAYDGNI